MTVPDDTSDYDIYDQGKLDRTIILHPRPFHFPTKKKIIAYYFRGWSKVS